MQPTIAILPYKFINKLFLVVQFNFNKKRAVVIVSDQSVLFINFFKFRVKVFLESRVLKTKQLDI